MSYPKLKLFKLTLLAILAVPCAAGQPAKTFKVLKGSTATDSLKAGTMLTATRWPGKDPDTVRVWVERTTRTEGPSREKASTADRVVWCYPKRYEDDRHLFPGANVVLSFSPKSRKRQLVVFTTESAYKKYYADDLGWNPVALH